MFDYICLNSQGDVIDFFYQWDINQKIQIDNWGLQVAPEFHFCNSKSKEALVVLANISGGKIIVDVPNVLLQEGETLIGYIYVQNNDGSANTVIATKIPVRPRPRPSDYVFVENTTGGSNELKTELLQLLSQKVNNNWGESNSGKALVIGSDGIVTTGEFVASGGDLYYANFHIDNNGNLIVTGSENSNVDYSLVDGELIIELDDGIQKNIGKVKGEDGFSPVAKVTQTDDGAVISITDKNGTTSTTIKAATSGIKSVGYLDADNTIILDGVENGEYSIAFEDWTKSIDEYKHCYVTVTDSEKEYNAYIPENCTPINAKRLGVYVENGNKVGNIRLLNNYRKNKIGDKLYSFGALSDVHYQAYTASEDFQRALTYLNETEDVEFTCICGDLTQNGTVEELVEYKNCVDTYSPNTPVYDMPGNHEGHNTDIANVFETNVGNPLYYSFTRGNDVFIMCGIISETPGSLFVEGELQWLYETLETNRNKRCFLFQHVRPDDACGNALNIYKTDIWDGSEATVFESLLKHYPNVVFFHGHSHLKFYLQEFSAKANYDKGFGCHSVHIPSISIPRDRTSVVDNTMVTLYADSEGYVVDVYEDGVMLRGRDFVNEKFLPIATYYLDTPLSPVGKGTFIDPTGTINTSTEVPEYTNQIPISTDIDGTVYNDVGYAEGYYISSSTGSLSSNGSSYVTGFIPCKVGDVIHLKNVGFVSGITEGDLTSGYQRIGLYDSSNGFLGFVNANSTAVLSAVTNEDGTWTQFKIASSISSVNDASKIAYFRLNGSHIGANSVITVNEAIE